MRSLIFILVGFVFFHFDLCSQVDFPWNPDADDNDFIGVDDLMSLLGVYGLDFQEEGLAEGGDHAFYLAASGANYGKCLSLCRQLPGEWWVPRLQDLAFFNDSLGYSWGFSSTSDKFFLNHKSDWPCPESGNVPAYSPLSGSVANGTANDYEHCVCFTKERRKIETVIVNVVVSSGPDGLADFQSQCDAKTDDGWIPTGPVQVVAQCGTCDHSYTQSFWRWE